MKVKHLTKITSTTEDRRFGDHLSTAVQAMRAASIHIRQAQELLKEKDFTVSSLLADVMGEVKELKHRLYRAGYTYWLEK